MDTIERFANKFGDSKLGRIMSTIRTGWNAYNFIFYIGGVSAILSGIFGVASGIAALLTLVLFYYAGRVKMALDKEEERKRLKRIKESIRKARKKMA